MKHFAPLGLSSDWFDNASYDNMCTRVGGDGGGWGGGGDGGEGE